MENDSIRDPITRLVGPYSRLFSVMSGAAGPVEGFTAGGYDQAGQGGKFLKIGIGILKRDTDAYDFVHTYPVVNEGKRGFTASKTEVRLTQDLADKDTGWGYSYVKTVRLVPGKAQMVIEHVLKFKELQRLCPPPRRGVFVAACTSLTQVDGYRFCDIYLLAVDGRKFMSDEMVVGAFSTA